jgi:hypothetical protein
LLNIGIGDASARHSGRKLPRDTAFPYPALGDSARSGHAPQDSNASEISRVFNLFALAGRSSIVRDRVGFRIEHASRAID